MPDIWSKLDDLIYDLRWYLAAGLLGIAMIGGGTYLITSGDQLLQATTSNSSTTKAPLPSIDEVVGQSTPTGPININQASQSELESLPGIGQVIAERIIEYREKNGPFKSKEELKEVKGIGDKTFADLEDEITIE